MASQETKSGKSTQSFGIADRRRTGMERTDG